MATYVGGNGALSETTGIEEVVAADVNVYGGEGFIAASADAVLNVFDLSGRQVAAGVGRVENIASGVYIVRALSNGKAEVRKVFVK